MVNIVVGGRGAGGTEERQWAGLVGELVLGMVVPGNAFGCKSLNNVTNSSFFFVPVGRIDSDTLYVTPYHA